jgi:hypothetical protein
MNNLIKLIIVVLAFALNITTVYSETDLPLPNYNTSTDIVQIPVLQINNSANQAFRVEMKSENGLFRVIDAQPISYIDTSNSDNPMDWVGKAHNAGVRYIWNKLKTETTKESSKEDIFNKIDELANEYFNTDVKDIKYDITYEEAVKEALTKNMISKNGSKILLEFFDLMSKNQNASLLELHAVIKEFEASVLKMENPISTKENISLTDKDFRVIYSVSSVARYSAKLWAPKIQGGDDLRNTNIQKIKWLQLVPTDCIGVIFKGAISASVLSLKHALSFGIVYSD